MKFICSVCNENFQDENSLQSHLLLESHSSEQLASAPTQPMEINDDSQKSVKNLDVKPTRRKFGVQKSSNSSTLSNSVPVNVFEDHIVTPGSGHVHSLSESSPGQAASLLNATARNRSESQPQTQQGSWPLKQPPTASKTIFRNVTKPRAVSFNPSSSRTPEISQEASSYPAPLNSADGTLGRSYIPSFSASFGSTTGNSESEICKDHWVSDAINDKCHICFTNLSGLLTGRHHCRL